MCSIIGFIKQAVSHQSPERSALSTNQNKLNGFVVYLVKSRIEVYYHVHKNSPLFIQSENMYYRYGQNTTLSLSLSLYIYIYIYIYTHISIHTE